MSVHELPYSFSSFTEEYLDVASTEADRVQIITDSVDQEVPIQSFQTLMLTNGDLYTYDHSHRVARAAVVIGLRLGLSEGELVLLAEGAESHDIGKQDPTIQAVVRSTVRFEPGSDERKIVMSTIKRHPFSSADLITQSSWSGERKRKVASIAGAHHLYSSVEPYGKKPDFDVAHLAEIVAAADMLDAFASERPYKLAFARNKVIDLLHTQFTGDPKIVEVAVPQPRSAVFSLS